MTIGAAQQFFLGASKATGGGAAGYQIERSLRFNSSDSGYLSRTPASAGNRKTWTWAGWVKRSGLSANGYLLEAGASDTASARFIIRFSSDNTLLVSRGQNTDRITSQVFRDVSAWCHLVVACDTTQATPNDRIKIYFNGTQITTFSSTSNPGPNDDLGVNAAAIHAIGRSNVDSGDYFNGYLADIHFIDGQALTPSSFTEVSATTGQLIPKAYTGSFNVGAGAVNGFWLKFSDNSAATAATLGNDYSGNNNDWTPNNLSVTAGAGNDSLVDTPTSYGTDTGAGGEVRGNYCTMNPLDAASGAALTLTNGNLEHTNPSTNWRWRRGTFAMTTGKWYWEQTVSDGATASTGYLAGVATSSFDFNIGTAGLYARQSSTQYNNGSSSTPFSTTTAGDVLGFAFDADAGKLWVSLNGTFVGSPTAGTGNSWSNVPSGVFPLFAAYNVAGNIMNFGQRPFAYTAPSGFKALCDTNLPAPVVAKPNTVMDVITYTGTGSSLALPNGSSTPTSISFTPDFAWIKGRSGATDHALYDAVRGVQKDLVSNSTSAETTETTGLTAFGTNTFTVGSLAKLNTSSSTYVAWAWNAGGSTVTNTQGSITPSVRANASAGFSIVTYTGTGSNATVGHGLGVAPSFIIVKSRSNVTDWQGYHSALGKDYTVQLMSTGAAINASNYWNGGVSSTTFGINGAYDGINANGYTYVAYCFSPVAGYSSFGSYVGNGSADGPFVFTGFRPKFILGKVSSTTDGWYIFDAARSPYNVTDKYFAANASAAEATFTFADFLSNGFKLRATTSDWNASGQTYIYAAFAESPFQFSRAR